jgi:hypothetical protein
MASIAFPSLAKKTRLSDGTTYGYVVVPPFHPSKTTFFLLHGFPSSCYDWRHQIIGLQKEGYGVIAPDLLGYGDADKPSDLNAYRFKTMCDQMVEIMDREGVSKAFVEGLCCRARLVFLSWFIAPNILVHFILQAVYEWDLDFCICYQHSQQLTINDTINSGERHLPLVWLPTTKTASMPS